MKSITTALFIFLSLAANAQIGKFLKDKVKENTGEIKNILSKEAEKKRESLDSLDVMYAISFTDNSALVNIHQENEGFIKGANYLLKEDKKKTKEEELREQMMMGKHLYAANQFIPATLSLHATKVDYEEAGLTKDINYYETIANLGLIYGAMSRYDKANEYTSEALDLRARHLGKESPAYIASLNNRAVLLKDMGQFNEAEQDLQTVVRHSEKLHGSESVQYAIALNNLAMLYQEVGRYKDAEGMMIKAVAISEDKQGTRSRNHERFLTNLAILQQLSGRFDEAEKTYLLVKNLQERFFKDKNNPELAHTLTNLSSLYLSTGRYDKVESLLKQAVGIYEKKFGKNHPAYATANSYLGNFYRGAGNLDEAEKILAEVVEIRKEVLGVNHPDYNAAIEDLAVVYWKKKEYEKATSHFITSLDKSLEFITRYFPPMSEAEKTRFWDKLNDGFERFYAFTSEAHPSRPELLDKMFSYRMATKALLMSSAGKLKKEILSSNDNGLKKLYQEWVDTKETIASSYNLSLQEQKEQKIDVPGMEAKANNLERELSARSSVFKEIMAPDSWPLSRLTNQLKAGEAAIEIIQFNDLVAHEKVIRYAALIIRTSQKPALVILNNGEQLDNRYFKYYRNVIQQQLQDEYTFNAYWKPLHEKLADAKKIYFSPDGIYSQLNPATFRISENNFVADHYSISNLTTLREIENTAPAGKNQNAILLGFPSYGSSSVVPLPGTKEEVRQINQVLTPKGYKVSLLEAGNATESNIKKAEAPRILHIATHGYFIEDGGSELKSFGINPGTLSDNPMLKSGLLLANASHSGTQQKMQGLSNNDNGILTAYEAINLELENTELVVLSACETGLGEVKAGEGVYGLQRAFIVAGADALIMSLWKVDDQATQQLMSIFYKEWLKGVDKLTAFRTAQQTLRKKYPHPFYWGAFVLIGS